MVLPNLMKPAMKLSDRIGWTELSGPGERTCSGPILDLLRELCGRQPKRRLPPLEVLNDLLARGGAGRGMGVGLLWDSGAILLDATTYDELCREIGRNRVAEGCEASTFEEWQAWCYQQDHGIDYDAHLGLLRRLRELERARAERDGEQLHLAYTQALTEYTDFINDHLRRE